MKIGGGRRDDFLLRGGGFSGLWPVRGTKSVSGNGVIRNGETGHFAYERYIGRVYAALAKRGVELYELRSWVSARSSLVL
jgi:hypothetical protein